jgi:hypothetical protein
MKPEMEKVWELNGTIAINGLAKFVEEIQQFTTPRLAAEVEVNRFVFRGVPDKDWALPPRYLGYLGPNGRGLDVSTSTGSNVRQPPRSSERLTSTSNRTCARIDPYWKWGTGSSGGLI